MRFGGTLYVQTNPELVRPPFRTCKTPKEKKYSCHVAWSPNSRLHGNLSVLAAKAAIAATADAVRTLFVAQEYIKHSRQPGRPNKSLQSVDKFKSCTF